MIRIHVTDGVWKEIDAVNDAGNLISPDDITDLFHEMGTRTHYFLVFTDRAGHVYIFNIDHIVSIEVY